MEAAMAYAQEVPMLILVQKGLKRQGMLSDRLEWKAIEANLDPACLAGEEFRQVFAEWIVRVKQGAVGTPKALADPADLPLWPMLKRLNAKQVAGVLLLILGAAGSIATIAFEAGQLWQASLASNQTTPSAQPSQTKAPPSPGP